MNRDVPTGYVMGRNQLQPFGDKSDSYSHQVVPFSNEFMNGILPHPESFNKSIENHSQIQKKLNTCQQKQKKRNMKIQLKNHQQVFENGNEGKQIVVKGIHQNEQNSLLQANQSRYKTHTCRHFLSGNCTLNARCNFAHSQQELRDPQDPIPSHVQVSQNVQITNYKTIKCRYFEGGFCKNGEQCSFAHGNLELLTPGVTLDNHNTFPQKNQVQVLSGMDPHQNQQPEFFGQENKWGVDEQDEFNYKFKNLSIGNSAQFKESILEQQKSIQDIFSSDNSNLIMSFANSAQNHEQERRNHDDDDDYFQKQTKPFNYQEDDRYLSIR